MCKDYVPCSSSPASSPMPSAGPYDEQQSQLCGHCRPRAIARPSRKDSAIQRPTAHIGHQILQLYENPSGPAKLESRSLEFPQVVLWAVTGCRRQ